MKHTTVLIIRINTRTDFQKKFVRDSLENVITTLKSFFNEKTNSIKAEIEIVDFYAKDYDSVEEGKGNTNT